MCDLDKADSPSSKKEPRNNEGTSSGRRYLSLSERFVQNFMCGHQQAPVDELTNTDLQRYLPPDIVVSRKDKKRTLFHTTYYENEYKLKQLYVKLCKSLPAYSCSLHQVKEVLKEKSQKKTARYLAINQSKIILLDVKTKLVTKSELMSELEDWSVGVGKLKEDIILEFRGSKHWQLVTSPDNLKNISASLWEAMDMDGRFIKSGTTRHGSFDFDFERRLLALHPELENASQFSDELNSLREMLNFPEEVASRMAETEWRLFTSVPPVNYVRQVTTDMTSHTVGCSPKYIGTSTLIQRFNEVSSWITQLIVMQPSHADRKAILSCILRLAYYSLCIGNFNATVEILAGLKSEKLKPFWLSLSDEEVLDYKHLCQILLTNDPTPEYREHITRALYIPTCRVIPFFGTFLRELRSMFSGVPSIVVLPSEDSQLLEFVSDYNGEDRFMTRIGVGGLINVEKLRQTHFILNDIHLFQNHAAEPSDQFDSKLSSVDKQDSASPDFSVKGLKVNRDSDTSDVIGDYDLECDYYQPIETIDSNHDIMFITPHYAALDLHELQCLHHGVTLIHCDPLTSRSVLVCARIDNSNRIFCWQRPLWSSLSVSDNPASAVDYTLRSQSVAGSHLCLKTCFMGGADFNDTLEEGFIDLLIMKKVINSEEGTDYSLIRRRHGIESKATLMSFSVQFGSTIAENRTLCFLAYPTTARRCISVLEKMCVASEHLRDQVDRRIIWLKERYLMLYNNDENQQGPTPAEAVKMFGGRNWSLSPQSVAQSNDVTSSLRRVGSFVISSNIFKKKGSALSLTREPSSPQLHVSSTENLHEKHTSGPQFHQQKTRSDANRVCSESVVNAGHKSSPLHSLHQRSLTYSYTTRYCSLRRRMSLRTRSSQDLKTNSITHSTNLSFLDFVDLFKSFSLRIRKDLRDLYDNLPLSDPPLQRKYTESHQVTKDMGLITRNNYIDIKRDVQQRRKICDAISVASIVSNCTGVDTTRMQYLHWTEFSSFLSNYQGQYLTEERVLSIIRRHEQDSQLRQDGMLSFEGFSRYLLDKDNYAFVPTNQINKEEMNQPLSHYYIATSHNTYLTGHQLKGESSTELYTQILKTGCRCVELDCWDGEDGSPVIYHGFTLTSKISFKAAIEAINESAFIASPYPVILSVENHCSIVQQQKMAQIFVSVFGDKLVTSFLYESDFTDDPRLPSPDQLKYKILIKNKKLKHQTNNSNIFKKPTMSYSRTNSNTSSEQLTSSSSCINEDEDDDDDDEDDDDEVVEVKDITRQSLELNASELIDSNCRKINSMGSRFDSFDEATNRFHLDILPNKSRHLSQPRLDWQFDEYYSDLKSPGKSKADKKANQIAQELSDLVVYTHAVRFRGLYVSPVMLIKQKKANARKNILGTSSSTPNVISASQKTDLSLMHPKRKKMFDVPPCHQVSSIHETKAKQLCRRSPAAVISNTERQIMRPYPSGLRIDSSNYNPVIFWAFGLQMVALNYQTEDPAMAINSALFESNGSCGYVLKPRIMWDKSHVMFNHFNPWVKEFDGLYSSNVTLVIVSGQYLSQNFSAGVQVEIEVIGIPVDCFKFKTKVCSRNALNPIWNEVFTFSVVLLELVFIRFIVMDSNSNHIFGHRVVPLKLLQPGYRHVRLHGERNQPLDLATLFIFSKIEDESNHQNGMPDLLIDNSLHQRANILHLGVCRSDLKEASSPTLPQKHKRRIFFVSLFGVTSPEEYVILKVTQDTTIHEAIVQALNKAGKNPQTSGDYIMIEEVKSTWALQEEERAGMQRSLDMGEKILQAQNRWKGRGKFILCKKMDDYGSLSWMRNHVTNVKEPEESWIVDENQFEICVFNVSPDQPYTTFQTSTSSLAIDVISKALIKARRSENSCHFVLIEETEQPMSESQSSVNVRRAAGTMIERRILTNDENVFKVKNSWKGPGKFILFDKETIEQDIDHQRQKKIFGRINKIGSHFGYKKQLTKSFSVRESVSPEHYSSAPPSPSYSLAGMSGTPDKPSKLKRFSSKLQMKLMKQ